MNKLYVIKDHLNPVLYFYASQTIEEDGEIYLEGIKYRFSMEKEHHSISLDVIGMGTIHTLYREATNQEIDVFEEKLKESLLIKIPNIERNFESKFYKQESETFSIYLKEFSTGAFIWLEIKNNKFRYMEVIRRAYYDAANYYSETTKEEVLKNLIGVCPNPIIEAFINYED